MNFAEETKRQAEIMLATKFDERGCISLNLEYRKVQYSQSGGKILKESYGEWKKVLPTFNLREPLFFHWDWRNYDYRIIEPPPAPEYVPYDFNDAKEILGMKIKDNDSLPMSFHIIIGCHATGISLKIGFINYFDLFRDYTKLDGSPCGKLKK